MAPACRCSALRKDSLVGLDLAQVVSQIDMMASRLKDASASRGQRLQYALTELQAKEKDLPRLKHKIEAAVRNRKTTWLVAGLGDGLACRRSPEPTPPEFIILASDGSHIDVDRHYSARCFLLNIGLVQLRYGHTPDARLMSLPSLHFDDEDTVISAPDATAPPRPLEGALLGAKRAVEECRALVQAAGQLPPNLPAAALLDGSLVLWSLSEPTYPGFVMDVLLRDGMLKHLSELHEIAGKRTVTIASYISFPRSTEVVNALRLAICPWEPVDCDRHCPPQKQRHDCDELSGLMDREVFQRLLEPGQRSAVFTSLSPIITSHYGPHRIHFFYLRLEEEVARVEIPAWVATDPVRLELTHATVLDQCRRGQGYPAALSEAHEQAVVTAADREQFWQLVEESMAGKGITLEHSLKSRSKRTKSL